MSKGIIIVDVPKNCMECKCRLGFGDGSYCGAKAKFLDDWEFDLKSEMPDWCPIKPVPERACHEEYWDNGRYDKGWNECLEAILKGGSE